MQNNGGEEMVDVVDRSDNVIGESPKKDVYKKGLSNRIVHIFVINPDSGEIFIQKRGAGVRYLPNYYCTSAGGHVKSGESYEIAARREMKEEIGLHVKLHFVEKFIYDCPETNPSTPRFISLYIAYANQGFTLSKNEVLDGFFVTPKELERILKDKDGKLHPQLLSCYEVYSKSKYFHL